MKNLYILILASVFLMLGQSAHADSMCTGTVTIDVYEDRAEVAQDRTYSVWLPATLTRNDELVNCTTVAIISQGDGIAWELTSSANYLSVEPFSARRRPLNIAHDGSGWVLPLSAARSSEQFWLRVRGAGNAAPGLYQGLIQAELKADELLSDTTVATTELFDYQVMSRVSMQVDTGSGFGLSGSNSHYRLDLGILETGLSRHFDLIVTANSDVRLTVESEHRGRLVHETVSGQSIPYRVSVNRTEQDLQQSSVQMMRAPRGSSQWRVPFEVTVLDVADARAGDYSDILTVTASTY